MKKIILIILLIISLVAFVFFTYNSFQEASKEGQIEEVAKIEEKEELEIDALIEKVAEILQNESLCTADWACVNSSFRAYQLENCTWTQHQECSLGCENSVCKKESCEVGYTCKDNTTRGFQSKTCKWSEEKACPWGCENGNCSSEPVIVFKAVSKNQETVINLGETQALTEGGIQHNISIYLLELSRVRMKIDRQRSDWIGIDGEFNHSSGLKITIEDISFQPYFGGTKAVTYIVK